ncbi:MULTISPECIES: alpha/beta hydrolase family protein [Tsukamurella]|uniref:S9 family peptidase n=2 Tax=Tsukamurella TaxID=2060 RepID=A0A5C5RYC8_9ACTN|nr:MULTISPECIES: S9 family peptidase [Tsukamurella]NMD55525.1 S9 family peptidase [Tsukamurella columbiensis]TWS28089.1 S9 family peptidase [Tsukamurella conjunctivitidis]
MPLPNIITVEEFFASPVRAAAKISPDGTRIAFLAPSEGRLNVWVEDLDGDEPARRVTADATRSVQMFYWTTDPRWLIYLQDNGGDERWHLLRADLDDPDASAVDLTPFEGATTFLMDLPIARPGVAIVSTNARKVDEFDVFEIDIATGTLTEIERNPGNVAGWVYGADGTLFASTQDAEGAITIRRWDSAARELRPIAEFDGIDYPLGVFPIVPSPDGGLWLGSNRGTDRTRVVHVDGRTGALTEVDAHPTLDLDTTGLVAPTLPQPLIVDPRTGALLGVRYLGERQEIHALDAGFGEVLTALRSLSDGDIGALSSDLDGNRWVVSFVHDRDPGVTYLYDHRTGGSRLLFRPFPHLDPELLAPMRPITITARDGRALPSFLTLPQGVDPVGLPLVLLVHGGPWFRDTWGYHGEVQLLANRGYAVLQVNFRGSTGYGKAHMQAGIGELAGAMHDDLIDAVQWAVAEGIADPERLAIFGGSYGGYAALVGVTFTPDVFAAAIDYVGISSLPNFMATLPEIARPYLANNWIRYVGDPSDPDQRADMLARSPITRVDEIRTPLLVVQGANDPRVVQAESDNLVEALRARGVDVEYMIKADEGHGFVNPENTIDMFRATERFLAQHLGGRTAEG